MVETFEPLATLVETLRASGEVVWYIDRHVLDVDQVSPRDAACAAAVAAGLAWADEAVRLRAAGCFLSTPCVIIDDDWLEQPEVGSGAVATPPHVYVCIALDREHLVQPYPSAGMTLVPWADAAAIPAAVRRVGRLWRGARDEVDELPGCWCVEMA